jgi:GNAT superfamily N-acetyltransferase
MPIVDPFDIAPKPPSKIVDPLDVKPEGPVLTQGNPVTMWESAMSFFDDPAKEGAKAVQAVVDSEALGISPSEAVRYRDKIDRGENINPDAAGLRATLGQRVQQSWDTGVKQNQIGELGYQYVMTGNPDLLESISAIGIPTTAETFIEESRLEGATREAAKMLPMMLDTAKESVVKGLEVGMGFGAIAALFGQAGPQAALPEEIITVPAATMLGFKIGATEGAFEASLRKEAGLSLSEIINFEDEEGNKIDPNIARAASFGIGAVNAAIELSQLRLLMKTIPGLDKLFSDAAIRTVASKGVKERLLRLSQQYIGTVAGETAQEVAQESTNIVFEELAKNVNNLLKDTDIPSADAEQVMSRLLETATQSAKGFAVISLPGIAAKAAIGEKKEKAPGEVAPGEEVAPAEIEGEPVAGVPEAMIIGVEENEEGEPISYTMADRTTGNTFEVEVGASAEEIQAQMDIGKERPPVEESIDRLIAEPEQEEAIIEGLVGEAPATRFEEFSGQVEDVVPVEQAKAVTGLLEARAKAVGMTADEYIEFHGLEVRKETGELAEPLLKQAPEVGNIADVKKEIKSQGVTVSLSEKDNIIVLSKIEVSPEQQKQGIGTSAMEVITNYADKTGQTIALTPSTDFGATSIARLKKFYKRLGFIENKGKNKDFTISESLYREPSTFAQAEQEGEQGIKAAVTFIDTRTIIRAFEEADVSSMVHELGHVFRRDLGGIDQKIAEEWAGAKDGAWSVEAEEKFARGFELYLREGKAPNAELKRIFEQFKQWLTEIYQTIKGSSLDVDISPQMRTVYDNLLVAPEIAPAELAQAKEQVKGRVRRIKTETTPEEKSALIASIKESAQRAREALKKGQDSEVKVQRIRIQDLLAKEKTIGIDIATRGLSVSEKAKFRRAKIRGFRDYFGLTDADLKKLSRKDIRLMDDYEFKRFADDMYRRAVELAKTKQKKIEVLTTIRDLKLQKTENYRKALDLPLFHQMTVEQLDQFNNAMLPFQEGDVFLSQRELETVDRTDLEGIRTWREARERLAEEAGVPIEELEKVKVGHLDNLRWDTALMDRNPFYNVLVTGVTKYMLSAQLEAHTIETKVFDLARKAEKSRKRTLKEKAVPQNKLIIEYLETPTETREEVAEEMTTEELDYAHYMQEYYAQALEYLISVKSLERGRTNYFVHMRKTFLEDVTEDGLLKAIKNIFKNYAQDEVAFNILDDDTGNILPLEKFFQFSMRRTGEVDPSSNVTKSFMTYVSTMEKKKALDSIIPKMDIYAQSLTPQRYTPRGLEIDRSLKKFVNKWINNKKGRKVGYDSMIKQGGPIDLGINALRSFTTMLDLGLSIPIRLATFVGEQVSTIEMLGVDQYALGTKRMNTKKGKEIVKKYEAFTGRSAWEEFTAPGVELPSRLMTGLFGMFHAATTLANKQFLLGSLTKEEYNNKEISTERLARLRLEMGRFRVVPGTSSLAGATSLGKGVTQYKSWAIPIMRTTIQNISILVSDLQAKPPGEALTTKEAREIYRMIGLTSTVLIVGAMSGAEDVDDSFIGKLKRKMYREALTLMQGLSPAMWLATPRMWNWLEDFGKAFEAIITLEEYEAKPGLKGVEGMKRQFIPRQLRGETKR